MGSTGLDTAAVEQFVGDRYESVSCIELLEGGEWSSAFGFRSADRSLVIRFGHHVEDYLNDEMATAWSRPGLPIPRVVEIGEVFDGVFAVSERMAGDKLDELPPDRLATALEDLIRVLIEMQEIAVPGTGYGGWRAPTGDAPHPSWQRYLTSVPDRDDDRLRGWRERLAARPDAQAVFDRAQARLEQLVEHCPDRRRLVHGDLLAGNVLVSRDNRISAVFDWGNGLVGDPLYDLAWLMFWAPWHPGIEPERVRRAAERFDTVAVDERLTCCQLHIAVDGMQYQAFAGGEHLEATARHTERLLDQL